MIDITEYNALNASLNKLLEIEEATKTKGWDIDKHADPISKSIVDKVKQILIKSPRQPSFIAPTAADSIQLEYDNDDGAYLEFNISDNEYVSMLFARDEDVYDKWIQGHISINEINEILELFSNANYDLITEDKKNDN